MHVMTFREGSLGCELPSIACDLLPSEHQRGNALTFLSTLTDRELLIRK